MRHRYTSDSARSAARARWDGVPADTASAAGETVLLYPLDGLLLRRVTVEDLASGETHILEFYGTRRLNGWRVTVDGRAWKTCGWSQALAMVRKSCVRYGRASQ